ncbi:unnamed protein product [Sphagnum balticum]
MVVEEDGHVLYHRSKDSHGSCIAEQKFVTVIVTDRTWQNRSLSRTEDLIVTDRASRRNRTLSKKLDLLPCDQGPDERRIGSKM